MRDRSRTGTSATVAVPPARPPEDARDITRTVPAWVCDRRGVDGAALRARSHGPELRLQVVQDEGHALAVQVAEGNAPARDALLYLGGRGVYGVATLLRRQSGGGPRLYVRLRAWSPAARGESRAKARGR